ncbi:hypothetical protein NX029_04230 [Cytobacillus firmus]|nr:hypothetical protein [Cytobacillus firmus]
MNLKQHKKMTPVGAGVGDEKQLYRHFSILAHGGKGVLNIGS